MIKFEGGLSKEAKEFLLKKSIKYSLIILISMFIFVLFCAVFVAIKWQIYWGFLFLIIFPILYPVIIYTEKKGQCENNIKMIIITNDYLEVYKDGVIDYVQKKPEDVKSVIDMGNFYWIEFYLPKCMYFLCQKDLIKEGSIEEFETLFADKIQKNYQ